MRKPCSCFYKLTVFLSSFTFLPSIFNRNPMCVLWEFDFCLDFLGHQSLADAPPFQLVQDHSFDRMFSCNQLVSSTVQQKIAFRSCLLSRNEKWRPDTLGESRSLPSTCSVLDKMNVSYVQMQQKVSLQVYIINTIIRAQRFIPIFQIIVLHSS